MRKDLYQDLYELEETHWWHLSKRSLCLKLLDKYLYKKTQNILLDMGCGTGRNMETFNKYGEVWGFDTSHEAILFCRRRGLKNLILGNPDKKFKSYFDCVLALDVLEHTAEKPFLNSVKSLIKVDGFTIFTVPAYKWLWSSWDNVLGHKRRYTKETLSVCLEENGFEILEISYQYSFLVVPAYTIRFLKSKIYKRKYPSDFQFNIPIVNKVLGLIATFERYFVLRGLVPFGTSLVCIAKPS